MHTSKDDYLINTLIFVSAKEETRIYGVILPDSLTSPKMKETKAYKTYLGFAIGATPPKKKNHLKVKQNPSEMIKDDNNNEQESSGEDSDQKNDSDDDKTQSDNENDSSSKHETDENESGSESNQDKNEEDKDDEDEVKDKLVKNPSNDSDDEDETKITDKAEGDEIFVQEEGTNAAMTNKTEVQVTSSSHSSDLVAKFLNFSDIPHTDAEIVSLMDVHVHHEVPSKQTPTLLTIPILVISESSPIYSTVIPQSTPSFTPPPPQSTPTPPPTTEAINPQSILLNFTSVF
ncbi:hypothetical protein Tco_1055496 [Tanacetum coccineum]|uniref:Uncharacterized protein n=1 Tax=Tanacetum coccineum TaxID=301880 RepID=A0ABQ5H0Q8_9ASTR